jgi:hypothetical protein
MDASLVVAALLGLVIGALALYVVIRLAVTHGLKSVELWKANDGVRAARRSEYHAATGLHLPDDTTP